MERPRIYLDAGHGGKHRGATAGGLFDEASYNLAISKRLGRKLHDSGYPVELSRIGDVGMSLTERAVKAAAWGAHLAISSHVNAHKSPALHGLLVFVRRGDWLARQVAEAIVRATPPPLRKEGRCIWETYDDLTAQDAWLERPHDVLSAYLGDIPAALVEYGYCSNAGDRESLLHSATMDALVLAVECGVARFRQLTETSSQPIDGYAL